MSKKIIPFLEEKLGLLATVFEVTKETVINALNGKIDNELSGRIREVVKIVNGDIIDKTNFQLREEATESVIKLLIENNLTELELSEDSNRPSIIWYDRKGNINESLAIKVSLDDDDDIAIDVRHEDGWTTTLDHLELDCNNLDWLCELRDSIIETLKSKTNEQ